MQPVTIIRVQTPVCAVPGCFCPSAAIVRCAGYATHTSPARAPPRRSCRATTSSLSRPTYLLLPAPSRAAPHRREKKKKTDAPRTAPHAAPTPPFVLPPLAGPFFLQRGAGGWRQSPRFPARLFTQQTERAGLVPPFRWPVFCVCCWDSYCCGSWVSFSLTSHRQFGRRMLC